MEIREYNSYNEPEALRLYESVGWTAYTDHPEVLRKGFENSILSGVLTSPVPPRTLPPAFFVRKMREEAKNGV